MIFLIGGFVLFLLACAIPLAADWIKHHGPECIQGGLALSLSSAMLIVFLWFVSAALMAHGLSSLINIEG